MSRRGTGSTIYLSLSTLPLPFPFPFSFSFPLPHLLTPCRARSCLTAASCWQLHPRVPPAPACRALQGRIASHLTACFSRTCPRDHMSSCRACGGGPSSSHPPMQSSAIAVIQAMPMPSYACPARTPYSTREIPSLSLLTVHASDLPLVQLLYRPSQVGKLN